MIPVVRLEPQQQWDQTFVDDLLAGEFWRHGLDLRDADPWPDAPGIILVIPGRYYTDEEPSNGHWSSINDAIAKYDWVVAFRVSDEEDWFDPKNITHPNIQWWVQTPRIDHDYADAHLFGVGATPHVAHPSDELSLIEPPAKDIDVLLIGQCTHQRRIDCFDAVESLHHLTLSTQRTEGFTQGLPADEYASLMRYTKIAPAPSGPVTPDSFRMYEALQMHAIPVADGRCPGYDAEGYWDLIHPDAPFPAVLDWSEFPELADALLKDWPANANRITSWWMREKHRYAQQLVDDLAQFDALDGDARSAVTVVMPASPIISHPDIGIIEQTLYSVRHHFPDAKIILTFDGVREEHEHLRANYEEAIRRTLWRCDHRWKNVTPLIFDKHTHQVGMMRVAMQHITTPLILYVEQDCPLVIDKPIDWDAICALILSGDAGLVRLHHESMILREHQHMTHGRHKDFTRTTQWSQRPHVASVGFYRRVLHEFSADAKAFIEDKMASVLECAYHDHFTLGWLRWPCWIYTPSTESIQRSYTLDGRAGQPKYDDDQRF